jgi:hypothetical protein
MFSFLHYLSGGGVALDEDIDEADLEDPSFVGDGDVDVDDVTVSEEDAAEDLSQTP